MVDDGTIQGGLWVASSNKVLFCLALYIFLSEYPTNATSPMYDYMSRCISWNDNGNF
jgi:hypothetical protein